MKAGAKILRLAGKIVSGGGKIFFLILLLTLIVLLQESTRTWILQTISQRSGWALSVENITFSWSPAQIQGHHITFAQPDGLFFTLQSARVGLDPTGWLEGRLSSLELEKPHLQLSEITPSQDSPTSHLPLIPLAIDHFRIIDGSLTWPATDSRPAGHWLAITLSGTHLSPQIGELTFSARSFPTGKLHGNMRWDGSLQLIAHAEQITAVPFFKWMGIPAQDGILQATVDLHLNPDGAMIAESNGRLDRLQLATGLEGSWIWSLHTQDNQHRLHLEGLARPTQHAPFVPTQLDVVFNNKKTLWNIVSLNADIPPYLHLEAKGDIFPHLNPPIRWRVNLILDKTIIIDNKQNILPAEWSGRGDFAGKITLDSLEHGWSGQMNITVQHLNWSRSSASSLAILGEHFDGKLQGKFLLAPDKPPHLDGQLSFYKGEWLVGSYYGDLAPEEIKGRFSLVGGPSWSIHTTLHSKTIPHMQVKLAPNGMGYSGQFNIKNMDLQRLFHTYLLEAWAADHPDWKTAQLSGRLETHLTFGWKPQKKPHFSGWLSLDNGAIEAPENVWGIKQVTLLLPLAKDKKPGFLRLQHLHIQDVTWPTQEVQLVWQKDTLKLVGILAGDLLGGRLQLQDMQIAHAWESDRTVSFALQLADAKIQNFHQPMGLPKLDGALQANFSKIIWEKDRLNTQGSLSAQLFEGELRLEDLSVERLFSGLPSWQTNVRLTHLDLQPLSEWLGVGLMEGTLSGQVDSLVMVGVEPLSFSATVATEESEKKQRISVKAIENIQTLGSGTASSVLQHGLLSLFDSFGYKQIGFQCRLKNDTFYLRGIKNQAGKEYLVVGSLLPPRVDVVSHNPVIGWKDMVARLKRITTPEH